MSKSFEMRREEKCFDYAGGQGELHKPGRVLMFSCHSMQGNQMWTYEVNLFTLKDENIVLSFRMICYDMLQVFVWNYLRRIIRRCIWLYVNRIISTRNGSGRND